MSRRRDRFSAEGLLPRMEARPWSDGQTISYRYKPIEGPAIALGNDKLAAIRKVLDLLGDNSDRGTLNELWRLFKESPQWKRLSDATRDDYTQASGPLLKVMGKATSAQVKPKAINRYLRVERASAPTRANREFALLSNLMNLAVERGDIEANPCKQVRRNPEAPRTEAPEVEPLGAFLQWAAKRGGQSVVLAGAAEFAALTGNRKVEFRAASWAQVDEKEVRLVRAKQRGGKVLVERIERTPALDDLLARLRAVAHDDRLGAMFPNRAGNAYTDSGFKGMWNKLVLAALVEKVIGKRFTFHDLRAYYVTQHKAQRQALPDLHTNPATTARVYDRNKEVKRRAL